MPLKGLSIDIRNGKAPPQKIFWRTICIKYSGCACCEVCLKRIRLHCVQLLFVVSVFSGLNRLLSLSTLGSQVFVPLFSPQILQGFIKLMHSVTSEMVVKMYLMNKGKGKPLVPIQSCCQLVG